MRRETIERAGRLQKLMWETHGQIWTGTLKSLARAMRKTDAELMEELLSPKREDQQVQ